MTRFYTTENLKIGPKRYFTPEGFLVCEDVPIGRTGVMEYGPGETPVEVGRDGRAHIDREAVELFSEKTLSSFNGKPVTNDHPSNGVSSDNWRDLAMGYVMNPRRGAGELKDFMIADLMLTDPTIIQEVLDGKREVSSGYDNDYIQFEPGQGRQVNIIGNHVALVQRGRCGTRCSIGDRKTIDCKCSGGDTMAQKPILFSELKKKITDAFKSKDEKALNDTLDSLHRTKDDAGEVHIHAGSDHPKYDDKTLDEAFAASDEKHQTHDAAIEDHENRLNTLEGNSKTGDTAFKRTLDTLVTKTVNAALSAMGLDAETVKKMKDKAKGDEEEESEEEKKKRKEKEGTEDESEEEKEKKKTEDAIMAELLLEEPRAQGAKDSAFFEDRFKETISMAEIIVPGIQVPTFDRAAKPGDTFKAVCGLRRKTLQLASKDEATAPLIKEARGKELTTKDLQLMSCDSVGSLFFAVGSLKKAANHQSANEGNRVLTPGAPQKRTIADVNKANRERFKTPF